MIEFELKPYVHADAVAELKEQLAPYRAVANALVPTDPAKQKADAEQRLMNVAKAIAFVNWRYDYGPNAEETIALVLTYKASTIKQLEDALKPDDEESQELLETAANFVENQYSARMISNLLALAPLMDSNPGDRIEDLLRGMSPLKRDYGHPTDYSNADEKIKREAAAVMDAAYARKFVRAKTDLDFISGGISPLKDADLIKLAVEFAGEPGRLSRLMCEVKSVDAKALRAALS